MNNLELRLPWLRRRWVMVDSVPARETELSGGGALFVLADSAEAGRTAQVGTLISRTGPRGDVGDSDRGLLTPLGPVLIGQVRPSDRPLSRLLPVCVLCCVLFCLLLFFALSCACVRVALRGRHGDAPNLSCPLHWQHLILSNRLLTLALALETSEWPDFICFV